MKMSVNILARLSGVMNVALASVFALLIVSGCHRRPLEDPAEFTRVKVKVNVDGIQNVTCDIYNDKISHPVIEPTAMHVLFFTQKGGEVAAETFITNVSTDENGTRYVSGDVAIAPGDYKMLIYDFGTETTIVSNYHDFYGASATTEPVSSSLRSRFAAKTDAGNYEIYNEPDHLVVASSEDENVPWHDDIYTIYADAQSVVESWYLQIKVDGAQYISGAQAILSGMVSSNRIATNTRVTDPEAAVWFQLQKSEDNGEPVICAIFNTFGRINDSTNNLAITFDIKTVDGKSLQKTFDISNLFLKENAVKHHWLLLEEKIKIDPPTDKGGGFDPAVDDWDNENTDIDI